MSSKKKIYLVEDDPDISEMIVLLLSEEEIEVEASHTVMGLYQLLSRQLPDLIVMDVMLPDGNGIDECHVLKKSTSLKHIPLLLMSAHAQSELVISECPADDFIAKPFDIYDFVDKVKSHLH